MVMFVLMEDGLKKKKKNPKGLNNNLFQNNTLSINTLDII